LFYFHAFLIFINLNKNNKKLENSYYQFLSIGIDSIERADLFILLNLLDLYVFEKVLKKSDEVFLVVSDFDVLFKKESKKLPMLRIYFRNDKNLFLYIEGG